MVCNSLKNTGICLNQHHETVLSLLHNLRASFLNKIRACELNLYLYFQIQGNVKLLPVNIEALAMIWPYVLSNELYILTIR